MRSKLAALLFGLALATSAAAQRPAATPPPLPLPPVSYVRPDTIVISVESPPAAVTCRDGSLKVLSAEVPLARTGYRIAGLTHLPARSPRELAFRIDADGRPLGIAPAAAFDYVAAARTPTVPDEELEAALASWRFPPSGAGHETCRLTLTSEAVLVADAKAESLFQVIATRPGNVAAHDQVLERAGLADGDCLHEPRAVALETHNPDPDLYPGAPGRPMWMIFAYDIDPIGTPARIRVVDSSATPAFRRAASQALAASRFQPKPRTACVAVIRGRASPLIAPPMPRPASFERPGTTCPGGNLLTYRQDPVFPPHFAARGIAGWALIGFDVAQWGAVGNVRVLAAEPASAFGDYAKQQIESATATTPGVAYTGCVVPVHFKIPGA